MSHIFISYSRKDFDFADKVVQALAENDLDTWIDWKNIPKGKDCSGPKNLALPQLSCYEIQLATNFLMID